MTRSRCHVCSATFDVQKHEMRYLGRGDVKNAQYQSPVSYSDWQAHIMLTCPIHRISRMPESCLMDLERIIANNKRSEMIETQIEAAYLESDIIE